MVTLCGQLFMYYIYTCLSDIQSLTLLRVHAHSYAQGLGVAFQPYARALTARAVTSNLSLEKTLSLAGIQTHNLRGTKLVCYQLSYPAWVKLLYISLKHREEIK